MKNTTKEQLSAFLDGETTEIEEHLLSRSLSQGDSLIKAWISYLNIRRATSMKEDPLSSENHIKLYREISKAIKSDETHFDRAKRSNRTRFAFAGYGVAASVVFALGVLLILPQKDESLVNLEPDVIKNDSYARIEEASDQSDLLVNAPELFELDQQKRDRLRSYLNEHDRMVEMESDSKLANFKEVERN
ncbi:MAG: RseA family anti-sigma factor [Candidatus Azotimanducaceae bacterium]